MAEIKIEKKSKNYWIWIILGLIILGVIIYFVVLDEDAATDDDGIEQMESREVGAMDRTGTWIMNERKAV